jgi:hypothetical protein
MHKGGQICGSSMKKGWRFIGAEAGIRQRALARAALEQRELSGKPELRHRDRARLILRDYTELTLVTNAIVKVCGRVGP